ncbi:amidohydrolase [Brenneria uluponensis]|uniref:amidohydrolase n=1 Tax=Brenneria uluponensis TaxID=3057057 RepID=UPI0028E8BA4C|nr:amidohydrolase [Brenneria ulupoensis]
MTHACNHSGGITCSCCSPLWKSFIPDVAVDLSGSNSSDIGAETLIVRTAITAEDSSGGTILTMENGQNVSVEAIGIQTGLIVATGSYDEVKAQMPKDTRERVLSGTQTLIPGLIEPHLHIIPTAVLDIATDVGPFLRQRLRTQIEVNPEDQYSRRWVTTQLKKVMDASSDTGEWVIGHNVDPSLFIGDDKAFNADILDKEIGKDKPVFIMNASMHLAYINSTAIAQVQQYYADQGKTVIIDQDGILKEIEGITPVAAVIGKSLNYEIFPSQLNKSLDELFHTASKRGVTYLFDAGIEPWDGKSLLNQPLLLKLKAQSVDCPVRIGGALVVLKPQDFEDKIDGKYYPHKGNSHFNLANIKLVSDGSNQGLTGYQFSPYCCNNNYEKYNHATISASDNIGMFNFGYPEEFDTLVSNAVKRDWPLMIHANGDQAIERTILAFQRVGMMQQTYDVRRDRIEHASLLSDQNLDDMKTLGISPSFLIGHVGYWGWVFQQTILGTERSGLLDRCQSALARGMRITLHSDNSVTPMGPLRMMEQAISRVMEGAPTDQNTPILNEQECISRFDALKAMTYDAAWQCHADQWVGSLAAGKCADFVLLADSPLTYQSKIETNSVYDMRNIPVMETWKGGRRVYQS